MRLADHITAWVATPEASTKSSSQRPSRRSSATLTANLHATRSALRSAEAPDRLALHLGRLIQRAIAGLDDADRVEKGVALARSLVAQIDQVLSERSVVLDAPLEPGTVLRAVLGRTPDGRPEELVQNH